MGSNVVSIRVEALGVSITIADGSIAIEQTKAEAAATPKVESGQHDLTGLPEHSGRRQSVPESQGDPVRPGGQGQEAPAVASHQALSAASPASPTGETVPTARPLPPVSKRAPPIPEDNSAVRGNSNAPPSPQASNGDDLEALMAPPRRKPRSGQTKPLWSGEEVEKLTALFPTHSARAIATQLGRSFTAIRSKAQNLGLKKPLPPPVRSAREPKSAPKPKSLSAAATADSPPAPGQYGAAGPEFSCVSLLDHHRGQCRWIVSDVWPVMYCGAPVVDASSWCEQHSTRVFNPRSQALAAKFRLKAWS